ncbi:UNVERIFIED_CONTAM: Sporulation protein kinase pit1 [Sesamum angustifolium]|uniref:Sporulation protein kinase pit1 n=1 Tax=Sesamum angustifolium TaxID=2727405 RepID=A0AAW2MHU6_9LAMI
MRLHNPPCWSWGARRAIASIGDKDCMCCSSGLAGCIRLGGLWVGRRLRCLSVFGCGLGWGGWLGACTAGPACIVARSPFSFRRARVLSCWSVPSGGGHLKEIHWLGESFAMRNFYGSIDPSHAEISSVLSLSHPNVLQYLCAFYDEDRKEGFLVMELMSKNLGACIKEHSGQRNRIPFSIPVAVDIMLQIARGMEYLHSRKIYHGDLNPSNVLLKAKHASIGGFQAKITGFGMTSVMSSTARSPKPTGADLDIWLAPEVLAEIGQPDSKCSTKYTDKADVLQLWDALLHTSNRKSSI